MNRSKFFYFLSILLLCLFYSISLKAAGTSNLTYNEFYRDFSKIEIDYSKTSMVSDFFMSREAASINLDSGVVYFCKPVAGRTCAAVFCGSGTFNFTPPTKVEQEQLKRFYKHESLHSKFTKMFMFFSDSTEYEISTPFPPRTFQDNKAASSLIKEALDYISDKDIEEVDDGITKTLLEEKRNNMFCAYIVPEEGNPILYRISPYDVEEVQLFRTQGKVAGNTIKELINQFHLIGEYENEEFDIDRQSRDEIKIEKYKIDCRIQNNLDMTCKAQVNFKALTDGVRWVAFTLPDRLEVDSIVSQKGEKMQFHKKGGWQVWIKLSDSVIKDQMSSFTFYYKGNIIARYRDIGVREYYDDDGNPIGLSRYKSSLYDLTYFKTSASYWYPRYGYTELAMFDIMYHYPDNYRFASICDNVSNDTTDEVINSHWVSQFPVRNVAFNIGPYSVEKINAKDAPEVTVMSVNTKYQDGVKADVAQSFIYFNQLFGPLPYKKFYVTEIPFYHGEAFPGMLQLSFATFIRPDKDGDEEIFRSHEVSHQWWGIAVDFATYHDQWLSEGFASYSSLQYSQFVTRKNDKFFSELKKYKESIINMRKSFLSKGVEGGPISLGYRNGSTMETSGDYDVIIYRKGAWVLHMLRHMALDLNTMNQDKYLRMIKRFFTEYSGKHATTKDFQKIAEEELGYKLDWFFEQWVDDNKIPKYRYAYKTEKDSTGKYVTTIKIKQENVPPEFYMKIPVKLEFKGMNPIRFRLNMTGDKAEIAFPPLANIPDNVVLNDLESVLAEVEKEDWDDIK